MYFMIVEAYVENNFNKVKTAKYLGISTKGLYDKFGEMVIHGIIVPKKDEIITEDSFSRGEIEKKINRSERLVLNMQNIVFPTNDERLEHLDNPYGRFYRGKINVLKRVQAAETQDH